VSRLYRNVLYLDPEAVPELAQSPAARAELDDPRVRSRREVLEAADRIDHAATLDAMLPVLRALHASFHHSASAERRAAYAAFLEREGATLRNFAVWEVLAEHLAGPGCPADTEWRRWPARFRDVRSPAVAAFRREHADAVDFRCWLQFELDQQLAAAAGAARDAGCALGIYQDLAIGSNRDSADTWIDPQLFAFGATVGAPPDDYAPAGQDWGFPPFDPHRLRSAAYRPWARLLRAAFAHAGALRLDHAMALLRLFWIPEGRSGTEGAYVAYRADELLGVLALESHRSAAVVIAEDLGTLPPELPALLSDWGLLRSSVFYFARDGERFRSSREYPDRSLATAGTHDLAPLAGLLEGSDLALQHRVGNLVAEDAFDAARREREATRTHLVEALRAESFLPEGEEPDARAIRDAVHGFLDATPAVLVGVSLDDLAGETEPVNVPGVPLERHRSWSRRMARPLDELVMEPGVRAGLEPLGSRSQTGGERR
jgi:4-alpha-glucanotransferase